MLNTSNKLSRFWLGLGLGLGLLLPVSAIAEDVSSPADKVTHDTTGGAATADTGKTADKGKTDHNGKSGKAKANPNEINITADKIVRDAQGVATATGKVVIVRQGETITADKVRYDANNKTIDAKGHVHIQSPQADIHAASGVMHTDSKTGELHDAQIITPDGEQIRAKRMLRLNEYTYQAFDPVMTSCPKDEETWDLYASEGTLNQAEGVFRAKNARFWFAGVPLFYSPYWQQAVRRKSGFMLPFFAFGRRRGTEWALPYYFAPRPNWDATITPHWMTARGLMTEAEVRHASIYGNETVQFAGIHDKVDNKSVGRLKGEGSWSLPLDMSLSVKGDEVNQRTFLADFSRKSDEATKRYLSSNATLSQSVEYGGWSLSGTYNHDLTTENNKATLQQYPNFDLNLAIPLFDTPATLYLNHNITRFSNSNGASAVRDWRVYSHPYVTLPLSMLGGGISTTLTAGSTYTAYWLNQGGARRPSLRSGEFSVDSSMTFERINDARTIRHSITPRIRYDLNVVRNQAGVPSFDSHLSPLRLSNLFSGNRFSGKDAVENVQRIAFLLSNNFQTKRTPEDTARSVLSINGGVQYNIRSSRLNPHASPTAFSNLLGSMTFAPLPNVSTTLEGEYDPTRSYWSYISDNLSISDEAGDALNATYLVNNSELATGSEIIQASGLYNIGERWALTGSINYDIHQKISQQINVAMTYTHPCWNITIEAHRLNLPTLTGKSSHNMGASILLGFKGLGSVGGGAK